MKKTWHVYVATLICLVPFIFALHPYGIIFIIRAGIVGIAATYLLRCLASHFSSWNKFICAYIVGGLLIPFIAGRFMPYAYVGFCWPFIPVIFWCLPETDKDAFYVYRDGRRNYKFWTWDLPTGYNALREIIRADGNKKE